MKSVTDTCGCCEGLAVVTPQATANRPGLSALAYRVGDHASFFASMQARLSASDYAELAGLSTRASDDPAVALLDAWATVADVLTFYQERIINEGYLRTATERRSILELARLVGYQLRPGVAASTYLAYSIDDNFKGEAIIGKGARAQSIPEPGEFPQSFETGEDLLAKAQWNNLRPRLSQPQTAASIKYGDGKHAGIYLKGINTNLKPNDPLLIDFSGDENPDTLVFERVQEVKVDLVADRTLVVLQSASKLPEDGSKDVQAKAEAKRVDLIGELTKPPSLQPANALTLENQLSEQFPDKQDDNLRDLASGEASNRVLKAFAPVLHDTLALAQANATVTAANPIQVYALRAKASLFGHNYQGIPISVPLPGTDGRSFLTVYISVPLDQFWPEALLADKDNGLSQIVLASQNEKLQKEGWLVIERPGLKADKAENNGKIFTNLLAVGHNIQGVNNLFSTATCINTGETILSFHKITAVQQSDLQAAPYIGFSAKADLLGIAKQPWLKGEAEILSCVTLLKETNVYCQSEKLELAEEPITEPVCGGTSELLELDGLYEGLEAGRWVVVSGEREITGTTGVKFNELAMIASVSQDIQAKPSGSLPGDSLHTFIKLANPLEYCFRRDTVTIYGNVVKASHGETRQEVLGSGDGAKALQSFTLKQPPLTYVSAANPTGIDSTLKIYVNDVQWHETDALAGLSPIDRNFISQTSDEGKTSVTFGNGQQGARLPTGAENIKANYRNGIGKSGNVKAGQISLMASRPLGAKDVINPLPATGGANKESRDQARKNVALAIKALDRLVSVQDYEDFARSYAGIGKASAREVVDGRRQLVHITVAGAEDSAIAKQSDLYRNLRQSLLDYGDPYQALQLEVRELMLIVLQAKLRILPDYLWEPVVSAVRTALLERFSFEQRELGQDVLLSELVAVMQAVPGVAYVDVDAFGGIPEKKLDDIRRLLTPKEISDEVKKILAGTVQSRIRVNLAGSMGQDGNVEKDRTGKTLVHPAQLAFFTPEVPATLILNPIS